MKPKTKKIIAAVMTIVFVLGMLALILPATISHKPSPATQDFHRLRQISMGLFVYASDSGKFPEKIGEILGPEYIEDSKENRDLISRVQYSKPSKLTQEKNFVMLVLPTKGGTFISYSNTQTEFVRSKGKS